MTGPGARWWMAALYLGLALLAMLPALPGRGLLWCADAAAMIVLLARPRRDAPALLAVAGGAGLVAQLLIFLMGRSSPGLGQLLLQQAAHLVAIGLGAELLRRYCLPSRCISRPSALLQALLLGGVVPALVGAWIAAAALAAGGEQPFGSAFLLAFEGMAVGSLAVLPMGLLLLAWPRARLLEEWKRPVTLLTLGLVLLLSVWAPLTLRFPFFHILLALLLVASTGRFAGTAMAVLLAGLLTGTLNANGRFEPAFRSEQIKEVLVFLPRLFEWLAPGQGLSFLPMLLVLLPPLLLASTRERIAVQVEALGAREAHFRHLYERTPVMMHSVDVERRLLSVNDEWLARLGYRREDVLGRPSTDFLTPESRQRAQDNVIPRFMRDLQLRDVDYQMLTKTGEVIDVHLSAIWETDADGQPVRTLSVLKDVTEQKRLAAELAAEKERIEVTLHSIGDGVVTTDALGRITYMNPVAEALVGWQLAEVRGRDFTQVVDLFDQASGAPLPSPLDKCLAYRKVYGLPEDAMLRNRQGQAFAVQDSVAPILGRDGALHGAVMVFQDVTEARGQAQRMSYLALHDGLTGLPNRVLFEDRVHQACQFGQRHQERFAVVFMDLDHFKQVNDTLGHAVGDELLKQVSNRLKATLRGSDTVCRLGGDEFVMLLGEVDSAADAAEVANKILREVAQPLQLDGHSITVAMSLGLALFPGDGADPATLMRNADAAMYRAKREGRNRCCFYAPAVGDAADAAAGPATTAAPGEGYSGT